MKEIRSELIREGAKARLLELNHERDVLLKIIDSDDNKKANIILHVDKKRKRKYKGRRKYNGTHWTQQPENKEKLRKLSRKMWRAKHNG